MKTKEEIIRASKFVLFSISAGVIQVIVFTILNEGFSLNYWVCYLTALVASVLWNFTFNRKFTFRSANNIPIAMAKVALFYLVFTPLSTIGGNALESVGVNEYIVLAVSMILNFVLEFLYDRFFVFGDSIDSAVSEKEIRKTR
ncbi:MAG: GtrA family protein [Oscillospiraceae bacterium]|nr:GtrA family protein [Oscillospiraceae bacterium]